MSAGILCAFALGCGGDVAAPIEPVAISVVTGNNQTTEVGAAFAQPVTFKVTDASATGVQGVSVSFSVSSGSATLSPSATTTNDQGLAATTVTAAQVAGPIVIRANASRVPQSATATLTALPTAAKFAGVWAGTTEHSLPVRMRIGATGTIDSLTIRLTAAFGPSTCTGTIVKTDVPVRADSTFETAVGIGFITPMRGRFTSATSVSGTVEAYAGAYGVVCGTMAFIGTGPAVATIQWQAQKQ